MENSCLNVRDSVSFPFNPANTSNYIYIPLNASLDAKQCF